MSRASIPTDNVQEIAAFLRSWRYNFGTERELQAGIWQLLQTEWPGASGWQRERVLADIGRIDFYHPPTGIGVEVKIDHALSALTRQVHAYAQHEDIHGLVVVTSKTRLTRLPESMNDKPIEVVCLIGSIF